MWKFYIMGNSTSRKFKKDVCIKIFKHVEEFNEKVKMIDIEREEAKEYKELLDIFNEVVRVFSKIKHRHNNEHIKLIHGVSYEMNNYFIRDMRILSNTPFCLRNKKSVMENYLENSDVKALYRRYAINSL